MGGKQAAVSGRGAEHTGTPAVLQSSLEWQRAPTSATAGPGLDLRRRVQALVPVWSCSGAPSRVRFLRLRLRARAD